MRLFTGVFAYPVEGRSPRVVPVDIWFAPINEADIKVLYEEFSHLSCPLRSCFLSIRICQFVYDFKFDKALLSSSFWIIESLPELTRSWYAGTWTPNGISINDFRSIPTMLSLGVLPMVLERILISRPLWSSCSCTRPKVCRNENSALLKSFVKWLNTEFPLFSDFFPHSSY